jgi:hypothetical protein
MAHFAKLNSVDIVEKVIVVNNDVLKDENGDEQEQLGIDYIKSVLGEGSWKQTSYNGTFRKNYAGVGMKYDYSRNAFYCDKSPYPSWELDEDTCRWGAPTPYPDDDKRYSWDEDTTSWKEIE